MKYQADFNFWELQSDFIQKFLISFSHMTWNDYRKKSSEFEIYKEP